MVFRPPKDKYTALGRIDHALGKLSMLECYLEAAPQLLLQVYVLFQFGNGFSSLTFIQASSILTSFSSVLFQTWHGNILTYAFFQSGHSWDSWDPVAAIATLEALPLHAKYNWGTFITLLAMGVELATSVLCVTAALGYFGLNGIYMIGLIAAGSFFVANTATFGLVLCSQKKKGKLLCCRCTTGSAKSGTAQDEESLIAMMLWVGIFVMGPCLTAPCIGGAAILVPSLFLFFSKGPVCLGGRGLWWKSRYSPTSLRDIAGSASFVLWPFRIVRSTIPGGLIFRLCILIAYRALLFLVKGGEPDFHSSADDPSFVPFSFDALVPSLEVAIPFSMAVAVLASFESLFPFSKLFEFLYRRTLWCTRWSSTSQGNGVVPIIVSKP